MFYRAECRAVHGLDALPWRVAQVNLTESPAGTSIAVDGVTVAVPRDGHASIRFADGALDVKVADADGDAVEVKVAAAALWNRREDLLRTNHLQSADLIVTSQT